MRILIVGERHNSRNWEPVTRAWTWPLARRLGAFNAGPSRRRLLGLGVWWTDSLCLLPPRAPRGGVWDLYRARCCWASVPDEKFAMTWACGKRVCDALGLPYEPCTVRGGRFAILPHPSGRCRYWNEGVARAEAFVRRVCETLDDMAVHGII